MSDPYAAPTDDEWHAIEARRWESERTFRAAKDEYHAAFELWRKALDAYGIELAEWSRSKALRTPVRDYVTWQLEHMIYKRPPNARKIDPYHRPADVQQVLDDLIAEGKVRRIGKGYGWNAAAS